MEFGSLDLNNLVLLIIGAIGLVNTILTIRANNAAQAANTIAIETNTIAVETREIAIKAEGNTKALATEAKKERQRMASLLDDALLAVKKNGGRRR